MRCPGCGFVNPAGARFCNQCGTRLKDGYKDKAKGRRRRIAVLFADISGFTPLSEKLDPEEVKDIIDRCLRRMADVIYKYEGYIDKFIGDCVMALFGAPVAHEDDPLRAALAGLELKEVIKKFNQEQGLNLALSIGINYGLVATGDLGRPGEYTVMGDTVNLAQRLQYKAPRGKIYVSASVYEQTKNEIVYQRLGLIKVKGKREKVLVYSPLKARRTYSLRRIEDLPLIGRQEELRYLLETFSFVRKKQGQVAAVVGSAGIGKSKLVYEFRKLLPKDILLIEGRGIEYQKVSSYIVLKQLLKTLIGLNENDTKSSADKKFTTFIRKSVKASLSKEISFIRYFLSLQLGQDDRNRLESMKPDDRMRLLNEAIHSFLLASAARKPLVIILEDCHWIDTESVNFMVEFARDIKEQPIMLVFLYRPEFSIGTLKRLKYFHSIHLKPLSPANSTLLLYDIFKCKKIDDGLIKLLLKKSGRIPFYIHELATNLLHNGFIQIDHNVATLNKGTNAVLPRTLNELIMTRVDKLDEDPREVVELASVIGDEFSVRIMKRLFDKNRRLKKYLTILCQSGLIRPIRRTKSEEDKYTFSHSLTREAIYSSLLNRVKIDYHKKAGYAIEAVYADNLFEYYDTLANHFFIGGEDEKAIEYLEKAGDRKKELYLNLEAIELYERAIDLLTRKPAGDRIARIYEKLGHLFELVGQYQKAKQAYTKMGEWGEKSPVLKARSLIAIANVLINQGIFDQALELLNKAQKILSRRKDLARREVRIILTNILRLECWIYRIKGMTERAEQKGREAISLIKHIKGWQNYTELKQALEMAYIPLAIVYSMKGEYERAIKLLENTLLIAEELGDRRALGHAYNNLGTIYRAQGRFKQAIDAYNKKLKISEELGDKSGIGIASCNLGNAYRIMGDYDKAVKLLETYLNIAEELGDKHGIGQANVNLGIVYWAKGEYQRSINSFEKYLKISEQLGDKRGIAVALGNLAEVYESKFEHKKALELLHKYHKMSRKLGDKIGVANASFGIGYIYTEIGRLKDAEKYLSAARKIYEAVGNKIAIGNVYNAIGYLRFRQGLFNQAIVETKKVLKLSRAIKAKEVEVNAWLNLCRIYTAQGMIEKSRDSFKKALLVAQKLKDQRLLADVYFEYGHSLKSNRIKDKRLIKKNLSNALKIYKSLKLKSRVKELEGQISTLDKNGEDASNN